MTRIALAVQAMILGGAILVALSHVQHLIRDPVVPMVVRP